MIPAVPARRNDASIFPDGFYWPRPITQFCPHLTPQEFGKLNRFFEVLHSLHIVIECDRLYKSGEGYSTITQIFNWWMMEGEPRASRARRIVKNCGLKEAIRIHFIYATRGNGGLLRASREGKL